MQPAWTRLAVDMCRLQANIKELAIRNIKEFRMTLSGINSKSIIVCTILAIILGLAQASGTEAMYARYPALSPDNESIAFSYRGDIWTVSSDGGVATRLTDHVADDIMPQFSPDGKWLLFSSNRFNNYDVFIMPVDGGEPKQLTFNTSADYGTGWFPDSDSILVASSRESWLDVFKISIDGGMPIKLTGYYWCYEYGARLSPDGRYMMFNNGSGMSRWWRRDLRSSGNADIWLLDRSKPGFESKRVTHYPNHDIWPVMNSRDGVIYFVSCRGEWGQVYEVPISGGEPKQITNFKGDGVQWMNSNPQGTVLVFEQDFGIWKYDPKVGKSEKIDIRVESDEKENLFTRKSFKGDVDWYSLSPDEKKIAAIVHGEIYVLPVENAKEGRQITNTTSRERYAVWGSDSKTLYYVSDRSGNYDLFKADAASGVETRLTSTIENETKPLVSPDGQNLIYYRGLDKIVLRDLERNTENTLVEGVFFDLGVESTIEYDWSPDSKWIVYTMAGPTYETDIYVSDLDGNSHNISHFADWNFRPRFSADGEIVYFSSTINDRMDTYKIDLKHKPMEFFESALDSLFMDEDLSGKDEKSEKDEDDKKEIPTVEIDFDKIEYRRRIAYSLSSGSYNPILTPDGEKFVFVASILGKSEIWSVNTEDDPDLKQLTHTGRGKSNLFVTSDSKEVLFLEGGKIKKCGIGDGKVETISFEAIQDIDNIAVNQQKYLETWSLLNSYFYDPDYHGADWDSVRTKYAPVIEHVRTDRDFREVVKEMMGELRASHINIYTRTPGPPDEMQTANTGITLDYTAIDTQGDFRVADVIPESPADFAGLKIGMYLRSVDGVELDRDTNLDKLLAGKRGNRLTITAGDTPEGGVREFTLKPISRGEENQLRYRQWVNERRRIVDSLSGGRLAYIHIQRMSHDCLETFKQELVSIAESKDGLVVDVRNNGGGNIAVHLLGILVKTPYFLRNFRSFPVVSENKMRSKAFERPVTLLINNYSASNSEIFAEGFRRLGLGSVIGEPTSGSVIGTSSYTLMDGTRVRRPSWGAYTLDMEDTDLGPRQPDILIENTPDDFINGRDPQLYRAVQELMKELE